MALWGAVPLSGSERARSAISSWPAPRFLAWTNSTRDPRASRRRFRHRGGNLGFILRDDNGVDSSDIRGKLGELVGEHSGRAQMKANPGSLM